MLTRLHIKDFQSHKDTLLRLKDFTVIVGASSSGKSSVVRALKLVSRNARGTSYVRNGASSTRISVLNAQFEGDPPDAALEVTVERGSGKSIYELRIPGDDEIHTFTKCGTSVPEMIECALDFGTDDMWLAGQFDRPFLLDDTGSQVARVLGELTNVSLIFSAVRDCNKRASAAKSRHTQVSLELDQTRSALQEYLDLPVRMAASAQAEAAVQRAERLTERRTSLLRAIHTTEDSQGRLRAAQAAIRSVPDDRVLRSLVGRRDRVSQLRADLSVARERMDQIQVPVVPNILSVQGLAERFALLKELIEDVRKSGDRLSAVRSCSESVSSQVEQAAGRLGTVLKEAGFCPACGASAEHARLEHVLP